MEKRGRLYEIVLEVAREIFTDAAVDSITVTPTRDSDGDDLYMINIVFKKDMEPADSKKMLGFVRHLRPKLEQIQEEGFPIVSYISKDDADELKREFA